MAKKGKAKKAQQQQATKQSMQIVQKPAARGTVVTRQQPTVRFTNDGRCMVGHTEFVTDVTGGATPNNYRQLLNPQNGSIFTWLSAIATRFEIYRFSKLKFIYNPSCGTSTDGYVVFGFDFDAYDAMPGKSEMLAWRYSKKVPVWGNAQLDVSADSRMATWRYCDSGAVRYKPGETLQRGDLRLDHLGLLMSICTAGSGANRYVGEMFVEYTVEFRQPAYKVPPPLYMRVKTEEDMPTTSDWFGQNGANTQTVGNMIADFLDKDKIQINSVGQWLVAAGIEALNSVSANLAVAAAAPSGFPAASFKFKELKKTFNTTSADWLGQLSVDTPPVVLTFSGATGSEIKPSVRFATYGNLVHDEL